MSEKVFFVSNNQKVCGILEEPSQEKRIVLLIHGHGSDKNGKSILALAHALKEVEINSFRIDLKGNGESDGKFEDQTLSSWVQDTKDAIAYLKNRGYTTIDLFGSSAGGTVAMITALSEKIRLLGLKAPPSDYPAQIRDRYSKEHFEQWKEKGIAFYKVRNGVNLYERFEFYEDAKKHDLYKNAKLITAKTLLVHGTIDTVIKIDQSKELAKHIPDCRFIMLEGADHALCINNDNTKYLTLFVDFFSN